MTYRELKSKKNQLYHGLSRLGLRTGDPVALLMGNKIEQSIVLCAAAKIGPVSVVLDAKWISCEIAQAFDFFNCNLLIYDAIHQSQLPADLRPFKLGAFAVGVNKTDPGIDDLVKDVGGVPDPERGEVIKALVVPRPGSTLSEDSLRAYCKENLAGYKVPKISIIEALQQARAAKTR